MPAQKKLHQSSSSALRRHLLLSTALTGIVLTATGQPSVAATILVTNTADAGAGSLRAAITGANPGDTINATPGLTGTINLGSDLPPVNNLTIDLTAGTISIAGAGARFKAEAPLHGEGSEFATLFGAIERAVIGIDPTTAVTA